MKTQITTASAPSAIGPYSQGIAFGNMIFTSGQIPLDASGVLVSGGIEEQTRMVMDNLTRVLEAAGAGLGDVVKTTVFLSDMADFASFNAVYAEYFAAPFPARSCVQAARLPRDVRVEIEAIAIRG
ncbi:MAG: RidA family protein [Eubacteriales bacterium]